VPSHRRSSASGGTGIDGGAGAFSVTESVGKALHLLVNRLGMRRRMGGQELRNSKFRIDILVPAIRYTSTSYTQSQSGFVC
jgi:hypothetical protein